MSPAAIAMLALALSVDAFVAALGRSAQAQRPGLRAALGTGAVFGLVEAVTPLLGWGAGFAAASFVEALDHWIAFTLLSLVGGRMVLHALAPARRGAASGTLLITALASSVDAFAVGISLAVLKAPILPVVLAVGLTTMAMATLGTVTGRHLGRRFGTAAEVAGGLLLAALGVAILAQHTLLA